MLLLGATCALFNYLLLIYVFFIDLCIYLVIHSFIRLWVCLCFFIFLYIYSFIYCSKLYALFCYNFIHLFYIVARSVS